MPFCDDFYNNLHIKDNKQENSDYIIMSDKAFSYLYSIYGGTDIRRLSIKILGEKIEHHHQISKLVEEKKEKTVSDVSIGIDIQ